MRPALGVRCIVPWFLLAACSGGGDESGVGEVPEGPSPFCDREEVLHTARNRPVMAMAVAPDGRPALAYVNQCDFIDDCAGYPESTNLLHLVTEQDGVLVDELVFALQELSTSNLGLGALDVAFDDEGWIQIVVSNRSNADNPETLHFRQTADGWQESSVLAGFTAVSSQLASGPAGTMGVILSGLNDGGHFASFDGSTWTSVELPVDVLMSSLGLVHHEGAWHASLAQAADPGYQAFYATDASGSWQVELLAELGGSNETAIAIDQNGAPVVFYDTCLDNCTYADIVAQRKLEGGWQEDVISEYIGLSDVTTTSDGRLVVLQEINGQLNILVEGTSWELGSLFTGIDGGYRAPKAGLDGANQLHVLFPRPSATEGVDIVYSVVCDSPLLTQPTNQESP